MKIMPVVFELEEDELDIENKMLIYRLFSKISRDNGLLFLIKMEKEDVSGFIIFNKKDIEIIRKIRRKVNGVLLDCDMDCMVSLPMIMDGVRFKKPTFYMGGKIRIID